MAMLDPPGYPGGRLLPDALVPAGVALGGEQVPHGSEEVGMGEGGDILLTGSVALVWVVGLQGDGTANEGQRRGAKLLWALISGQLGDTMQAGGGAEAWPGVQSCHRGTFASHTTEGGTEVECGLPLLFFSEPPRTLITHQI